MPSGKRHIVEALLYAAILTLLASRRLLAEIRRKIGKGSSALIDDDLASGLIVHAIPLLAALDDLIHEPLLFVELATTIAQIGQQRDKLRRSLGRRCTPKRAHLRLPRWTSHSNYRACGTSNPR